MCSLGVGPPPAERARAACTAPEGTGPTGGWAPAASRDNADIAMRGHEASAFQGHHPHLFPSRKGLRLCSHTPGFTVRPWPPRSPSQAAPPQPPTRAAGLAESPSTLCRVSGKTQDLLFLPESHNGHKDQPISGC